MIAVEKRMLMNEIEEQIQQPEREAVSNDTFLPGEFFFSERVEFGLGLNPVEVDSTLETQLEAHAPFSLEQLNFGAWVHKGRGEALIYAACREQLFDQAAGAGADPVRYPCFLPFLGYQAGHPCILTCLTENHLSLLVFDKAGALPCEVHSLRFEGDATDASLIEKLRADLLRDLPWIDLPLVESVYTWKETLKNWKNDKTFISVDSLGKELRLELNAVEASRADVRDREIKQKALKTARWNHLLWLSSLGSAVGILLISLLALVNWIWSIGIQSRSEQVQQRQTKVQAIEAKERNLQVFESGSAAQLQPLAMLDIINRVRPDGIFFSSVKAFEGNQLQVDGAADANGTVLINQFRDELNKLNSLESVSVEITRINQGVSYYFRANLKFKEIELANVGAHQ